MKIVKVEWTDSVECTGWRSEEDITTENPIRGTGSIRTVGILVAEEEDYIAVATSVDGNDEPKYCATMIIPTHAINEISEIEIEGE